MLILAPLLFVLFVALMAIFPVAGAITALVGGAIWEAVKDPEVNGTLTLLILVIPCGVTFAFAMALERRAVAWAPYARIRHAIRVVGLALVANQFVVAKLFGSAIDIAAPFGRTFSFGKLAFVVAVMVAAHVGFRRLRVRPPGTGRFEGVMEALR